MCKISPVGLCDDMMMPLLRAAVTLDQFGGSNLAVRRYEKIQQTWKGAITKVGAQEERSSLANTMIAISLISHAGKVTSPQVIANSLQSREKRGIVLALRRAAPSTRNSATFGIINLRHDILIT